jgi:hypothetical protein
VVFDTELFLREETRGVDNDSGINPNDGSETKDPAIDWRFLVLDNSLPEEPLFSHINAPIINNEITKQITAGAL